jgi:hypothetical protein
MTIIGKDGEPKFKIDEHNDVLDLRTGQQSTDRKAYIKCLACEQDSVGRRWCPTCNSKKTVMATKETK